MLELTIETRRRTELCDITDDVRGAIAGAHASLATLFVPHTTAGIVVQAAGEGASQVAADLEKAFERLVDERRPWRHATEGDRNPASHVRAALTAASVAVPVADGRLALGAFQAIFLAEFDGPRTRTIYVTLS